MTPYTITYAYVGDASLALANNTGTTLTVYPGPLDHFAISAIASPQVSDTPFTIATITAQDAGNDTVTNFTGTVTFGGTAGVTGTSGPFTAGVLNNASVTPTVAGSSLTVTVSDGAGHTGSATIATVNEPTPSFSNLTASQTITYDTAAITLGGKVSATGPLYPAQGETITVIINGNAQTTSINDATGDFSFSYNPATIPASMTPYTIAYLYAGDASLAAAVDASTTLTVNLAPMTQNHLFEADAGGGDIYEFTTNGTKSAFATGLDEPIGLAFNSAGVLFEADALSGDIYEFTTGGAKSTFATGLNGPAGLAFDSAGDLFEADAGSGSIYEFTNGIAANKGTFATNLSEPFGLAFDSAGDLFVADAGSDSIYEFTPNGTQSTFASGLSEPVGLAFDSAGDLFEADLSSSNIYEFTNGVAANKGTFATNLSEPVGLAFNSAGVLFEANLSSGNIYEFTMNGTQSSFASGLGPSFLAFQPHTPVFSGLTASQSITQGTTAITLAGNLSATNPATYPPQGEAITVTINGNVQTTTISDSAGDFSFSYNPSTIPASATPYTITYSYAGDYWLLALGSNVLAATAASTTLTVNQAAPAPSFSNLSASQSAAYGTTAITLAGKVSAPGPIYPASGETITVTINGNAQTTAIDDANGDFSFSYNPSTIPASAIPYTITYSYAGDGSLTGATNTSTTLTVNPLAVVLTGTRGYDGTATAAYGILSVSNKVGSDVVTVASGSATLAGASVGTQAITSVGTLALAGANAVNYTLTGASGSVTISNPFNPFTVTSSSLDVSGTNFVLCWQSVPGVVYTVLTNTSLAPPQTWAAVGSPITATGTNTCFTLPGGIVGKTNTFVVIKQ